MTTETRRGAATLSGDGHVGSAGDFLIDCLDRREEVIPPQVAPGVSPRGNREPRGTLRILQEGHDAPRQTVSRYLDQDGAALVQESAVRGQIGGHDRAPRGKIVEHLERQVVAVPPR